MDIVSKFVKHSPLIAAEKLFKNHKGIIIRIRNLVAAGKLDVFTIFLDIVNTMMTQLFGKA